MVWGCCKQSTMNEGLKATGTDVLPVLEATSRVPSHGRAWPLPRAPRANLPQPLPASRAADSPWACVSPDIASIFMWPSMCLLRTPVTGFRAHPLFRMISRFLTNCICDDLVSSEVMLTGSGVHSAAAADK